MTYEFSFTRTEWWITLAACVLLLVLAFAAGFLAGSLWQRSRTGSGAGTPAAAIAPMSVFRE